MAHEAASRCLGFAADIARSFVRSETKERCVTQMTLRGPFDESNLRHERACESLGVFMPACTQRRMRSYRFPSSCVSWCTR
jgi:hypothetical protein